MKKRNSKDILERCVSGYHEYVLTGPYHLQYASQSLCDILNYTSEELVSGSADLLAPLIHPADSAQYRAFLDALAEREQTRSVRLRIVDRNGDVHLVLDTMTSSRASSGEMTGYAVLSDMTECPDEDDGIRLLRDRVPCGLLRCTCEKNPRVTHASRKMAEMLGFRPEDAESMKQLEFYKNNIFLAVSAENRSAFARVLHTVYIRKKPVAGEVTVTRADGSRARLFGWVMKYRTPDGQDEFQMICVDITGQYQRKKTKQSDQYLQALANVYEYIFEYDRETRMMRCLKKNETASDVLALDLPMMMEEATERWIGTAVAEEDRERLREFLQQYGMEGKLLGRGLPVRIGFRLAEQGHLRNYQGIILQGDGEVRYFCCRKHSSDSEMASLRTENDSLKNLTVNMQELVEKLSSGVVAFEITGDMVRPLYASSNACAFFGYTAEEWRRRMQKQHTIRDFVSRSGVKYEVFEKLFRTGEGEFSYTDMASGKKRAVKAVCSDSGSTGTAGSAEGTAETGSVRYVLLYSLEKAEDSAPRQPHVFIRTFGYFDVFVDDRPIMFKNEKAKELFALLVDRRGGYVSASEAIGILWEDEPASPVVLARYRKVALRLKNLLEEYGIPDTVEYVNGQRRIVVEKTDCDLFTYLAQDPAERQPFGGNYLTNYSWGETTLGELMNLQ